MIFNQIPVFIDGRADMYGDAYVERFFQAIRGGKYESDFLKILSDYDIRWAISVPGDELVESLGNLSDWKEIYRDEYGVVHVREAR